MLHNLYCFSKRKQLLLILIEKLIKNTMYCMCVSTAQTINRCVFVWVKPAFLSSVSVSIYIPWNRREKTRRQVSFASAWRMFCISNQFLWSSSYNWTGVGEIWQEERQAGCLGARHLPWKWKYCLSIVIVCALWPFNLLGLMYVL